MTAPNLEALLQRVKKQVAEKEKKSAKTKLLAKLKRQELYPDGEPTTYQREENWLPIAIHREYEVQTCDCCRGEKVLFQGDKVELRHKIDHSARRWIRERGESFQQLPMQTHVVERVIPECWECFTLGKQLLTLFKGIANDRKQTEKSPQQGVDSRGSSEAPSNARSEETPSAQAGG